MDSNNNFFSANNEDNEDFIHYDNLSNDINYCLANKQFKYYDACELEEAIEFFLLDDIDQAHKITDYALTIFPDNVNFLLYKAEILIEFEEKPLALEILDKLENIEPFNTEVYLLKVSLYAASGEMDKAISECHRALINDIDTPVEIYLELGYCYKTQKKYKDALKCYQKCINIEKSNPEPYYSLADIYIQAGLVSEGLFYFDSLLLTDEENINALFAIGKLYAKEGIYKRALQSFSRVLRLQNDHYDALFEKIHVYKKMNRYSDVVNICKKYKEVFFPVFLFELAKAYREMGYPAEALEVYQTLYKDNHGEPDVVQIIAGIADTYLQLDETEKALATIENGLQKHEDASELLLTKAWVMISLNQEESALEIANNLMQKLQADIFSEMECHVAELLIELKSYETATVFLNSCLKTDPYNAAIYYLLAATYYLKNQKTDAYEVFEKALSLSGDNYHLFFDKCMLAHADDVFYELLEKYNQ